MKGISPLFHSGRPSAEPPRSARDLVAVAYRQAGLIAICTVLGTGVSWTIHARQPRGYASSAKLSYLKLDPNPGLDTGTGTGNDATPVFGALRSQGPQRQRQPQPELRLRLQLEPKLAQARPVPTDDAPNAHDLGAPPAEGHETTVVAAFGPAVGSMLGLLLAVLREFSGQRMRSPREAEWALGVPVLGAIPTLSAKVRDAYLFAHADVPTFAATELA